MLYELSNCETKFNLLRVFFAHPLFARDISTREMSVIFKQHVRDILGEIIGTFLEI